MNTIRTHSAFERDAPFGTASASGVEFAWKVHGALQDWTAKVDTKASIVMTLETALFSGMLAFTRSQVSAYPRNWSSFHHCGLVLLFVSIVLAGAVVFPQLHRRDSTKSWSNKLVYFGHLRLWEPSALTEALASAQPEINLRMLSDQLVAMSRITWRKHVLVQWSLLVALTGCIGVGTPLIAIR
ncbi:MAG: Pycsar system effector family protein [Pseudonocardiaceae bacterium]